MIVVIDPVCTKCNRNDPKDHDVKDWTEVKALCVVDTKWACPKCGSKAAYWYVYRNTGKESLTTAKDKADYMDYDYWQCFGKTDAESKTEFTRSPVNTVTREAL